jgi:LysR family nitrogen assimilation transcriptional regulator
LAINLKQLTYLRKAVEVGNMTRAAQELNVAQTALGTQIRNLEEELGVTLLERHSRGVTATPACRVLVGYTDDLTGLLAEAREAMRKFSSQPMPSVNLGVTPSIMRLVGDDILVDLSKLLPHVNLHIVEEFSFILTRLLEQGELTCALTYAAGTDASWLRVPLLEEDLFYLTAPHLTPDTDTITFDEVLTNDLALTGRDDVVFRLVEALAHTKGVEMSIAYEVQSLRAVKNLVAKGIAATIMPYGAAEGELRSGALRSRLIIQPSVVRTLQFVSPPDQASVVDSPEFRAFIKAISDRLHAAPGPVTRQI